MQIMRPGREPVASGISRLITYYPPHLELIITWRRVAMDSGNFESLTESVAGRIVTASDADYEEVRSLWNGMIDRHPAAIVQCRSPSDAIPAIQYARDHDLPLAIRGAGHNIAGNAMCDGGMVVDFSQLNSVNVDAGALTRRSTILHGIWILIFVVIAPQLLELLPRASLGAILVYTGYRLIDWRAMRALYLQGRSELFKYVLPVLLHIVLNMFWTAFSEPSGTAEEHRQRLSSHKISARSSPQSRSQRHRGSYSSVTS